MCRFDALFMNILYHCDLDERLLQMAVSTQLENDLEHESNNL